MTKDTILQEFREKFVPMNIEDTEKDFADKNNKYYSNSVRGTREDIESFLLSSLTELEEKSYQKGVEDGIVMMADDETIADKAIAKLHWNKKENL